MIDEAALERARLDRRDAVVMAMLVVIAVVLRRPSYQLSHPFWLDEAWVADSVAAGWRDIPRLTSITPIGWTAVLHLFGAFGRDRLRLLPMALSAATVVPAYMLGFSVFRGRLQAVAVGAVVAAMPVALLRNDLKAYTADGLVALTLFLCTARLDARWSRLRVGTITAIGALGMLVSLTAPVVAAACLAAAVVVSAVRRSRIQLLESLSGLAVLAVTSTAAYAALYRQTNTGVLHAYWHGTFAPNWPAARALLAGLHVGPWWLALALAAAGVAVLLQRGRTATALVIPIVLAALVVAGALELYPFMNARTSYFLSVLLTIAVAVTIAALLAASGRSAVFARAAAVLLLIATATGTQATYGTPLPAENVRDQVRRIRADRRPGEPIVVDRLAAFAFAYYWSGDTPRFIDDPTLAVGFVPAYDESTRIFVLPGRSPQQVDEALARAATAGPDTHRSWLVVSHVTSAEAEVFRAAAQRHGRTSEQRFGDDLLVTVDR